MATEGRDFSENVFAPLSTPEPAGRDLSEDIYGAPAAPEPTAVPGLADVNAWLDAGMSPRASSAGMTTTPTALLEQARSSSAPPEAIADAERLIASEAAQRRRAGLPEEQPATNDDLAGIDPRDLAGLALSMLVPAAGAAGGAALGARTVAPRLLSVVGELLGSWGARKANVAIGAEEPGTVGDIASVAIPGGIRGVQALRKPLLRHLPGASVGQNQEAVEQLGRLAPEPPVTARPAVQAELEALTPSGQAAGQTQSLLEGLRPPTGRGAAHLDDALTAMQPTPPAAALYGPLATDTTPIRPSNILREARALLRKEAEITAGTTGPFEESRLRATAEQLRSMVRQGGGVMPLNTLIDRQQRLGLMVGEAANKGWPEEAGLRRLYRAFYADIDHAANQGVAGATQLRQATQTHNREMALEDVRRMLAPGSAGVTTTTAGQVRLPPGEQLERRLDRQWANDPLFAQAFSPAEKMQLRHVVREVRSAEAIEGFLERLQAGKPGMATGATGTTSIANVTPLREALERELVDNPTLATAIPGKTVTALRTSMQAAEHEQSVQQFLERLQPGRPGIGLDPVTGSARIENVRPLRVAFEREVTDNPRFTQALGAPKIAEIRASFETAAQEHVQERLAHMLRPGAAGLTIRADGLIQPHAGQLRKNFEQALQSDTAFAAGVPPDTRTEIRRVLSDIESLPKMPPVKGQHFGSGRGIIRGAIAAGASQALGTGPFGSALAVSAAIAAPDLLARAMMSPTGRSWLVKQLAKEGGALSPALLGVGNTVTRQAGEDTLTAISDRAP